MFHIDYSVNTPFACILSIELTMEEQISNDKEHLGKAFIYNERILRHQPQRGFAITVVTNLKQFIFVQTTRNPPHSSPKYNYDLSPNFAYKPYGWAILLRLFTTSGCHLSGYNLPNIISCNNKSIHLLKSFIGSDFNNSNNRKINNNDNNSNNGFFA